MKDSTSKSSFWELQEFIEEGSLTINDIPTEKVTNDKNEIEEKRQEMLNDNRLEKYNEENKKLKTSSQKGEIIEEAKECSYFKPNLKYYLDRSEGCQNNQKSSFKMFQAMTLGDTYDASQIQSYITSRWSKYKPKIFEILK